MGRPPKLMGSGPIQRQNYDCDAVAPDSKGRVVCARLSRQRLALRALNRPRNVSFGSRADIQLCLGDFRFMPKSGPSG